MILSKYFRVLLTMQPGIESIFVEFSPPGPRIIVLQLRFGIVNSNYVIMVDAALTRRQLLTLLNLHRVTYNY